MLIGKLVPGLQLGTFIVLFSGLSLGEPSPADRSLATELFQEGRSLLAEGHVVEACRKLAESQRLDPGGGTLLNLASCHEQQGLTATAWTEFMEARSLARRDQRPQRLDFAETHIAALEPKLSRLVVLVPPAVDAPGLEVQRDGSAIGRAAWGTPMPVDPGEHEIEVTAPGKQPYRTRISLGPDGDRRTVTIPELAAAPGQVEGAPSAAARGATSDRATSRDNAQSVREAPSRPSAPPSRTGMYVAGVAGLAAVGVGAVFGVEALAKKNESDNNCPTETTCNNKGSTAMSHAMTFADVSTVAFALGAAGLGIATYLYLSEGPRAEQAPGPGGTGSSIRLRAGAGLQSAGVSLEGAF